MEPKYKVNPLTGELQEYVFEYNGILALRNFTARVEDERLILHAADDVNFSILEALVSEVEINGVVYDNPTAAQEALTRLTFNQNRPVLLDKSLKDLILGAVQKVEGKGLSSNDFTNAYKQQLDTLEDYDIELDESTTELKFKKGSNVIKRISLMFLDDEGTKLVYNRTNKTLELRDKRDNLLTSIPVSHFVSNIPTGIIVQNGKIKLMAGSEVIDENTISYNDLADKPELNYLPLDGGTVNGNVTSNNFIKKDSSNEKVLLGGGGDIDLSELKNENIKVGGRNLLRKTKEFVANNEPYCMSFTWSGKAGEIVSETFNDNVVRKINSDWQGVKANMPDILGEPVTISFWAKTNGKGNFGNYANKNKNPNHIEDFTEYSNNTVLINDNQWHRYTIYNPKGMCLGEGSSNGFIEFYSVSGDIYYSSIKIEIGNTPTDWSPAPEDLALSSDIHRTAISIDSNYVVPPSQQNNTILIENGLNIDLSRIEHRGIVSFLKLTNATDVTFSCPGKTIRWFGDTNFSGKEGSTAVVTIYNDQCIIKVATYS